jgi:hypothetical protein
MKKGEIHDMSTYRTEVKFVQGILWGKHEGKTQFGGQIPRYVVNIKVGLKTMGFPSVDWIHDAQDNETWWTLTCKM